MQSFRKRVSYNSRVVRSTPVEVFDDELLGPSRFVHRDEHAVARAGERAGAIDDLREHGLRVQARRGPRKHRAQTRDAPRLVASIHLSPFPGPENTAKNA